MEDQPVVTCFLRHRGDVLLLRRSQEVGSYRQRWGAVAGHVEADDPDDDARREIDEETGLLAGARLGCRGEPFAVEDEDLDTRWIVHPYLFDCAGRDAELDRESVEGDWVSPTEILRRQVVPDLWTSWRRVAPTPETIEEDHEHGSAWLSLRALEVLRDRAAELVREVERDETTSEAARGELRELARRLRSARPAMAALENRVSAVMETTGGDPEATETAAHEAIHAAHEADDQAAARAAELVAGQRVLTLSRSGTVTAALLRAAASDPPERVWVAESRPLGEGVGVAEELAAAGLSVTLLPDAALAHVLACEPIHLVLVGADTILASGAVVNKVGTRMAALAAGQFRVPFYAVAAQDKISKTDDVPEETLDPGEVYAGEANLEVVNTLFDVTPVLWVAGWVTEAGILDLRDS